MRTLFWTGVALAWAFAAGAAAELVLRLSGHAHTQVIAYDPQLGWRYLRHFSGPGLSINSQGFRDGESPPPGEPVALFLGDSYTAGLQVSYGATFPRRFEEEARRRSPAAPHVVQAAVSAWATDQQYLYFRSEGRSLHPKLVFLMVAPNDVREVRAKRFFRLGPGGLRELPRRVPPWSDRFRLAAGNRSALFNWVGDRVGSKGPFEVLWRTFPPTFAVAGLGRSRDEHLFLKELPPEILAAEDLFLALIEALRREVVQAGGELVVAVVPTKLEFAGLGAHYEPGRVARWLAAECHRRGIRSVDLFGAFAASPRPLDWFLADEYHLSEKGHAKVAELLADAVWGPVTGTRVSAFAPK